MTEIEGVADFKVADFGANGIDGAKICLRIKIAAHAAVIIQKPRIGGAKQTKMAAACAAFVTGETLLQNCLFLHSRSGKLGFQLSLCRLGVGGNTLALLAQAG